MEKELQNRRRYNITWENNDMTCGNELQNFIMDSDLFLVRLDIGERTYASFIDDTNVKIEKFTNADENQKALVVKAIAIDEDENYITLSDHDMIILLSIIAID